MNLDDGGWVLDKLVNQTKEAVFRKTYKAKAQSDKFNEWWFAVASSLTIGVPDNYVEFLLSELKQVERWSRLLLVNREKPEKSRMLDLRPT